MRPNVTRAATVASARGSSRLLRSFLVLSVSTATMAASFSGALFTDSDDVTVSGIVTGSIDLTTAASIDFSLTNMAPGDSAGVQQLTVTNGGSLELRYSLSSTSDEDALAAVLDLDIWLETQEAGSDGTCDDVVPGAYLYQGIAGSTGGATVFGDPTAGADTGDRTLAAAASEVVCFDMTLPLSAANALQATTSNITFTFDSEQTANNA